MPIKPQIRRESREGIRRGPTAAAHPPLETRLRPSERVMQYLRAEFERPELKEGARLPTVRDLASRLRVSSFTVRNVFQHLAREGRLRTEVGNGTFLLSPRTRTLEGIFKFTLNLHLTEGSPQDDWASRIGSGILRAVMRASQNIALVPVSKVLSGAVLDLSEDRSAIEDAAALNQQLLTGAPQVDGLILFPFERFGEVQAAYERAGKLVVNLNPPTETATANFVSSDYYHASFQLGSVWRQTGRREIGLLTVGPLCRSVSSRLRYAGLANGLENQLGRTLRLRVVEADSWREEDGERAVQDLLAHKAKTPDAIYCGSDQMALGAVRCLRERGFRIPQDVSVVGGTGLRLADSFCPQLTRLNQPCEQLGEELVTMLGQRIDSRPDGSASVPGKFLPVSFIGGATTRAEENALLGLAVDAPAGQPAERS
ncbi:MAG: substrate-binding domain-containing protein [Verrucomicrobia bacterium]|nr:substrate-binding domain-containing protein [Verrucomicrobiota bacterium]